LSSSDAAKRGSAAARLFEWGRGDARGAIEGWLKEADFRELVLADASADGPAGPRLTVGVAVQPGTFAGIRRACGNPRLADVPPEQSAQEFELEFGHAVRLDILTSTAPDGASPLASYLRKFGQGIQQVEMEVSSVDQATRILQTKLKLKPAYEETRIGADGTRVNFFLTSSSAGKKVLIELVER
jgi:hypothetical protein